MYSRHRAEIEPPKHGQEEFLDDTSEERETGLFQTKGTDTQVHQKKPDTLQ